MLDVAGSRGLAWQVALIDKVDRTLMEHKEWVVATSDSWILDECGDWIDLAGAIIRQRLPETWLVDLSTSSRRTESTEQAG